MSTRPKARKAYRPEFTTEIVFLHDAVAVKGRAYGWGDDASSFVFDGKVEEVTIARDGKPYVSVRIRDDGKIIVTGYQTNFTASLERNFCMEPTRPMDEP